MKFKLVKHKQLSGKKASVYSVWFDELQESSLAIFVHENGNEFKNELKNIVIRLSSIGKNEGAIAKYFKMYEGVPGDGVCALYDIPQKKLRLYCIRFGSLIVVVGGGGPKNVQKLQQDNKLKDENYFLRNLSARITKRLKEGELWFTKNGMEFGGNLEFNDEDDE